MELSSKNRAYLRSLANSLDAIFQIGKGGLSDNLIKQISDALEARELIKIHVLDTAPNDISFLANDIATKTSSIVVQIMGNKITLFRVRKKNSKIFIC